MDGSACVRGVSAPLRRLPRAGSAASMGGHDRDDALGAGSLQERAHRHLLCTSPATARTGPTARRCSCSSGARGRTSSTPRASATSTASRACSAPSSATPTARRWPRSPAEQLSTLAFNTNWGTAHPPAIELAERARGAARPATSTACSSPTAARSRSRPRGRSCASTTSRAASRSASRRSRARSPTTA